MGSFPWKFVEYKDQIGFVIDIFYWPDGRRWRRTEQRDFKKICV